jgi:hypothetical protein
VATDLPDFDYFPPPKNPVAEKSRGTVKSRSPSTKSRSPTASRPAPKPKPQQPDYREAVSGIFQLATAPLLIAGQALKKPALIADAAILVQSTPGIANAVNNLAHSDPKVAAILDRLLTVGPYGETIAELIKPTAQIIANHRPQMLPALQPFGAIPPDELIASFLPEEATSDNGAKASTATA